jgi:putative ATP-dependent endonuclease of OLD family
MKISKIEIFNYRGIKETQEIPLSNFSSIVGKNDSGKSIILNAIASFLNLKEYPITNSDFNSQENPIEISCTFKSENLSEILASKIKSKIKKTDGLDEFLTDLIISGQITIKKTINTPKKSFDYEQILITDYDSDDFAFLYGKTDEELTNILNNFKIIIPIQGTERNSKLEKIKRIKEYCSSKGIKKSAKFINDDYKICSLLPDVELFKADYGLEADTKFKSNSVSEIIEYLDQESQVEKKLAIVEYEIASEMQKEAQSVKKYMNDYVSNLKKVEIIPTIVWKDAIKSVDVSFQFDGDLKPIPMSHKGAGYRRLFMVARFRYLAEKNKGLNIVYLIEEPETFLHPSAQNDLLNAFRDLSEDKQVIITTHSPVFAGATNIESVILCKKYYGSTYEHYDTNGREAFIDNIVKELGIKPSYNLRDCHEKIVFVESHNDARFYNLICQRLIGKNILNNKKVLVLPFGGGEDIDSFLNIDYFDNSGRDLYLIIDSDKHQDKFEKQTQRATNFQSIKAKGKSYVLKKSCLENYYHHRAFERTYGLPENSFPIIDDKANVKMIIKKYKIDNILAQNIKEKNNFDVFEAMTKEEWEEVIEDKLLEFIKEIVQ